MSLEHALQREPRKRIRRAKLAELFGVNIRTIDYWWKGNPKKPDKPKVLPPPHYLDGSVIPFWYDDEIPEGKSNSKQVT
jgi:hypothetical protein